MFYAYFIISDKQVFSYLHGYFLWTKSHNIIQQRQTDLCDYNIVLAKQLFSYLHGYFRWNKSHNIIQQWQTDLCDYNIGSLVPHERFL
jgi:hypothetical protein